MIIEVIKNIPSFPGYQASSLGRVYNFDRVLKTGKTIDGYPRVSLRVGNRWYHTTVHRLVCEAFHGQQPSKAHEVRHLDGSKNNNHPDNLRWGTRKENQDDMLKHGTYYHGEKCVNTKLTTKQVLQARKEWKAGKDLPWLCAKYKMSKSAMYQAATGITWKHLNVGSGTITPRGVSDDK